jgi:PhzF family phenazine biosynthesis protein
MGLQVARMAAFSADPRGGNPAGVVVCEELPPDATMQGIAREVGYSETVFLAGDGGASWQARYFSPVAEVRFCGHATIAGAIALHERCGASRLSLETVGGVVDVTVDASEAGTFATLTSVKPHIGEIAPSLLARLLALLSVAEAELDPALPVRLAFAGVHHPIIALASRETHARLEYDFEGLRALMTKQDWTTIQVVWRASPLSFRARNPFPVGGILEDPATGAAAAALGAYLREIGAVTPPLTIEVLQGEEIGRPSQMRVTIPERGGIEVSGTAVTIPPALL